MSVWNDGLSDPLLKFMKKPDDLESIIEMYQILSKQKSFQEATELKLKASKEFVEMYESWYAPTPPTLAELSLLPADTFGSQYAGHMRLNNLDPNYITAFEHKNILSYLWLRARQVHDIGHMLTGFDTSYLGEVGLKGFEIAQYGSPSSAANISAGIFGLICIEPKNVNLIFETFIKGYELGRQYPLFMAIKWDNEWQTPMSELRRKYHLNPLQH